MRSSQPLKEKPDAAPRVIRRTEGLPPEQKMQIEFALAAFDTLKAQKIAYISIPITSGRRLYDYMAVKGFKTQDEAKQDEEAFFDNVVAPNLAAGLEASNHWRSKLGGAVIAPVEFEKKLREQKMINWGQDAFMGMWVPLIEKKVTHMVMVDGWQFSNGSGEEYLQAVIMQMGYTSRSNIRIIDVDGRPLSLDKGIGLIADAFTHLHDRGLKSRNMAETLGILLEAEIRYSLKKGGRLPAYDHTKVDALREKVDSIFAKHYPDVRPTMRKAPSTGFSPINALFRHAAAAPERQKTQLAVVKSPAITTKKHQPAH